MSNVLKAFPAGTRVDRRTRTRLSNVDVRQPSDLLKVLPLEMQLQMIRDAEERAERVRAA